MRGQHFDAEAFLGERTTKDFCDRENTDFTRNALCHRSEVARISIANHIFLSSLQLDEPIDLLVDHFCYFLETSAQVNPSNGFREGVLTLTRKFYKHVRLSKRKDARRLAFTLMDRMTRGAIDNLDPLGAHSAIFFRLSLLHTLFSVYPAASKSEMVNVATVSVIQCVIHSPFELCRDLAFGWLKTYADTNALAAEHARLRSTANTLIRDIKTLTRLRGGMVWRLVGLVDRRLFPEKVFHEQEAARQLLSAFDMALSAYEIDFQAVAPTIHGVIESLSYICRDAFPSMTAATFAAALPFLSSLVTLLIRACDGALHFFEKTQFLEIGDVDHDDADWEGDNGNLRGTLIACAWRTLKTGGAILVDVVTVLAKYANVGDVQQAAESRSLVLGVGNLLMKILLEVRHWGAANWTQAGFTRFCGILSGSSDEVLQAFPQKALDDLLSMLNDDTRIIRHDERHAGLARLLLSVLNGIFPKPAARDAALRPILAKFVGMVQKATSERAKVNALNMLLWVVKDAKTGHMIPLEEMLVVCFDGLRSKEQHVRNASSVLFSSVISRFLAGDAQHSIKVGVSRNLDTFFSPRLHLCAEVLEELRRMGQGTLPPPGGQYPVLSLLSRLDAPTDMSASAPEGSAAELAKLLLVVAQRSKLWHVRELAASCFVRFARIDLLVETFVMVATDLVGGDSNYIHGNLLVLKDLSKRFTVGDVAKVAVKVPWLSNSMSSSDLSKVAQNAVTLAAYLDILSALHRLDPSIPIECKFEHSSAVKDLMHFPFGIPLLTSSFVNWELSVAQDPSTVLKRRLADSNPDVVNGALNWLSDLQNPLSVTALTGLLSQLHARENAVELVKPAQLASVIFPRFLQISQPTSSVATEFFKAAEIQTHSTVDDVLYGHAIHALGHAYDNLSPSDRDRSLSRYIAALKRSSIMTSPDSSLPPSPDARLAAAQSLARLSDAHIPAPDHFEFWNTVEAMVCDEDEDVALAGAVVCSLQVPVHALRAQEILK